MVHYPAGSSPHKMGIKGWTWSATMLRNSLAFKWCSIGTKRPKVCQENIPHTFTPPPPAWTVETRQDGSMLSCSLLQILTLLSECCSRNRDSSDQATFFQSSIVQFYWACVNCCLRFLFLADRTSTGVVFCCWSPSASGFDVFCVQRWYSAYLGCNEWLFELLSLSFISNQSAHSPLISDINKGASFLCWALGRFFLGTENLRMLALITVTF